MFLGCYGTTASLAFEYTVYIFVIQDNMHRVQAQFNLLQNGLMFKYTCVSQALILLISLLHISLG